MSAYLDARCDQCNTRIGWMGTLRDRPPCPRCGHRPSEAVLQAIQNEMDQKEAEIIERLLADDKPA